MQFALESDAPRARHVHRIRFTALDLDYLGTLVGEYPCRHWSGDHPGEIEDPHALERQLRPSSDNSFGGQGGEFLRAHPEFACQDFAAMLADQRRPPGTPATANR